RPLRPRPFAHDPRRQEVRVRQHDRAGPARSSRGVFRNTPFYRGRFPFKNQKNSDASATPVCDGTHVFVPSVADGAVWLTAINLAGKVAWQSRLGPFASEWGYAS